MKHHKKSKGFFKAIAEKFSYKPKSLMTAASLFAAAGALSYINYGSSDILAAPSLEIIRGDPYTVDKLIAVLLIAGFVLTLSSIKRKK